MSVSTVRYIDTVVLSVNGRINYQSSEGLSASLLERANQCRPDRDRLVIDLGEVDYISSVGLRALMVAAKTAASQSGTMVVANPTPEVKEILEISRFDKVFKIYDSVADALEEISDKALEAFKNKA